MRSHRMEERVEKSYGFHAGCQDGWGLLQKLGKVRCWTLPCSSFTQPFVSLIFPDHPLCIRPCARCWAFPSKKRDLVLTFVDLRVYKGSTKNA